MFTSDGILPDPAGFLQGAVAAIKAAGGLFVADEVQPGFGRTGEHMWGFQRHDVIPDIVTMGKPMGNGQPIAGLLVTRDAVAQFGRDSRYFNTFAGNTVSCAAAVAVLDTIERYEAIGDVRGVGMFVGVEIVADRATRAPDRALTSRVVNLLRDKGILISGCAKGHNVLKIRPPLVLNGEQVDMVVQGLDECFAETTNVGASG
jgi:4-aminobutyrate aminotransferase-like enzyme